MSEQPKYGTSPIAGALVAWAEHQRIADEILERATMPMCIPSEVLEGEVHSYASVQTDYEMFFQQFGLTPPRLTSPPTFP